MSAAVALLAAASAMYVGSGAADAAARTVAKPQFTVNPSPARVLPLRNHGSGTEFRSVGITFNTYGAGQSVNAAPLDAVRVAVDASALKGVVQLRLPKGCAFTKDQLHAACSLGNLPSGLGALNLGVRAAIGGKVGAQGNVVFKVTAANAVEQTWAGQTADAVQVGVADGPDMVVSDLGAAIRTPAGRTTALPLRVTNLGSTAAKGVIVYVHDQYGHVLVPGNAKNCVYETYSGGRRGATCTFPSQVIEPGQTFEVSPPLSVAVPAGAHGDQIFYAVTLTGDASVPPDGKAGTGAASRLVQVPSGYPVVRSARVSDVDIDGNDSYQRTNLNTGFLAQISAVGGSFHGTVGKVTTAWAGARNSGNTVIRTLVGMGPVRGTVGVFVDFPGSVKVVRVPKGCFLQVAGPDAGAFPDGNPTAYECVSTAAVAPGRSVYFGFGIRPLKAIRYEYAGVYALALTDVNADMGLQYAKLYLSAVRA